MNSNLEIGRIVLITFGPSIGKIGIVLDIVDEKRILIDGPCGRPIINIKRITAIFFRTYSNFFAQQSCLLSV